MPERRDRATGIRLDLDDAMELAELLSLVGDWIEGQDADLLATSLKRFVGTSGYELADLQTDIGYFVSLLDDSEPPLRPDQP